MFGLVCFIYLPPINVTLIYPIRNFQHLPVPFQGSLLEWWKGQEKALPVLSKMAKRFLCCQTSNTASEREFSGAGSLATKVRNRLSA